MKLKWQRWMKKNSKGDVTEEETASVELPDGSSNPASSSSRAADAIADSLSRMLLTNETSSPQLALTYDDNNEHHATNDELEHAISAVADIVTDTDDENGNENGGAEKSADDHRGGVKQTASVTDSLSTNNTHDDEGGGKKDTLFSWRAAADEASLMKRPPSRGNNTKKPTTSADAPSSSEVESVSIKDYDWAVDTADEANTPAAGTAENEQNKPTTSRSRSRNTTPTRAKTSYTELPRAQPQLPSSLQLQRSASKVRFQALEDAFATGQAAHRDESTATLPSASTTNLPPPLRRRSMLPDRREDDEFVLPAASRRTDNKTDDEQTSESSWLAASTLTNENKNRPRTSRRRRDAPDDLTSSSTMDEPFASSKRQRQSTLLRKKTNSSRSKENISKMERELDSIMLMSDNKNPYDANQRKVVSTKQRSTVKVTQNNNNNDDAVSNAGTENIWQQTTQLLQNERSFDSGGQKSRTLQQKQSKYSDRDYAVVESTKKTTTSKTTIPAAAAEAGKTGSPAQTVVKTTTSRQFYQKLLNTAEDDKNINTDDGVVDLDLSEEESLANHQWDMRAKRSALEMRNVGALAAHTQQQRERDTITMNSTTNKSGMPTETESRATYFERSTLNTGGGGGGGGTSALRSVITASSSKLPRSVQSTASEQQFARTLQRAVTEASPNASLLDTTTSNKRRNGARGRSPKAGRDEFDDNAEQFNDDDDDDESSVYQTEDDQNDNDSEARRRRLAKMSKPLHHHPTAPPRHHRALANELYNARQNMFDDKFKAIIEAANDPFVHEGPDEGQRDPLKLTSFNNLFSAAQAAAQKAAAATASSTNALQPKKSSLSPAANRRRKNSAGEADENETQSQMLFDLRRIDNNQATTEASSRKKKSVTVVDNKSDRKKSAAGGGDSMPALTVKQSVEKVEKWLKGEFGAKRPEHDAPHRNDDDDDDETADDEAVNRGREAKNKKSSKNVEKDFANVAQQVADLQNQGLKRQKTQLGGPAMDVHDLATASAPSLGSQTQPQGSSKFGTAHKSSTSPSSGRRGLFSRSSRHRHSATAAAGTNTDDNNAKQPATPTNADERKPPAVTPSQLRGCVETLPSGSTRRLHKTSSATGGGADASSVHVDRFDENQSHYVDPDAARTAEEAAGGPEGHSSQRRRRRGPPPRETLTPEAHFENVRNSASIVIPWRPSVLRNTELDELIYDSRLGLNNDEGMPLRTARNMQRLRDAGEYFYVVNADVPMDITGTYMEKSVTSLLQANKPPQGQQQQQEKQPQPPQQRRSDTTIIPPSEQTSTISSVQMY